MAILKATSEAIHDAARALRRGEVVAYPTETLYGLGVMARDGDAIERLYELKGRGQRQPLSVLVADLQMLDEVVDVASLPAQALALMEAHWPGPLTLVLPGRQGLAPGLSNDSGGIGVRISPDPVARSLLAALAAPLTATSANLSGQPPAKEAAAADLPGVTLTLDDGVRAGAASTVAALEGDRIVVLRQGGIRL